MNKYNLPDQGHSTFNKQEHQQHLSDCLELSMETTNGLDLWLIEFWLAVLTTIMAAALGSILRDIHKLLEMR